MYCYFGHHKCGTGWIRSIIQDISKCAGWRQTTIYDVGASCSGSSLAEYLRREKIDFLCYTNADTDHVRGLGHYRGFHVIRDPRDIVVSAYFSHMHSHTVIGWPELISHREKLKGMNKDDGLMLQMEFIKPFLDLMGKWDYGNPNVLEIKMEKLSSEPEQGFFEIFQFLGLLEAAEPSIVDRLAMIINPLNQKGRGKLPFGWPLSPIRIPLEYISEDTVSQTIEKFSFSSLSGGRKLGEEDQTSHYRKGEAGDWVNHFSSQHTEYFTALYGDLLKKLGYE